MTSTLRQLNQIDLIKTLWLILTGGAFVSLAGGALTLMYFWSIGGVPIGQASSTGALAKIVLPTALFFAGVLLCIWLAPTLMSSAFVDEKGFTQILQRLFTNPVAAVEPINERQRDTHVATLYQPQRGGVLDQSNVIWTEPEFSNKEISVLLNFKRVLLFALLTVGSGCGALTLVALGYGAGGTPKAWAICLGIPVAFTGFALIGLWEFFNRRTDRKYGVAGGAGSLRKKKAKLVEWLVFGYLSATVAIAPLLAMLLAFLRSDTLLEDESALTFLFGAIVISLAITFSYAASLAVLVQRTRGAPVQWGTVLAINAIALFSVVMALGLTSRMLEAVMVMASVRVENAVVTLEPEGCELLESMQVIGWGRAPGTALKTCTLYGVTIQTTLEPSMQIACWRGILATKQTKQTKEKKELDASGTEGTHPPPSTPGKDVQVGISSEQGSSIDSMKVTGSRGAFYMPVKYVRSVWKTAGLETPKNQDSVCPQMFNIGKNSTPTKMLTVK